jgi:hypothetical protein
LKICDAIPQHRRAALTGIASYRSSLKERPMRRRVLLALMFVLAAAFVAHAQQQWVEHRPAGAGYRIEFPEQPTLDAQEVATTAGNVTVHIAKVGIGDVGLVAMHNSYPKGTLGDPTDALSRGRDNVLRMKASRKLRSDQNLSVGGAPAKRIIIDDSDGNQVIIDLMVVSGDNLYQAITASPKGGENSPDVQRFFASLALVAR